MSWDEQVRAYTLLKTTDHYDSADSVLAEWRKYEKWCDPKLTEEQLDAAVNYRLELFHNFFKEDEHGVVCDIHEAMKALAGIIDCALLENECDHDFFYYQEKSGSILTYDLEPYDIYNNAGVNEKRITKRLFDRDYYQEIPPCGLLLPELRDQISDYRNTATWNMTKPTYSKIIAAPDDIRRANLLDYLGAFRHYVWLYNEDGILRELQAVFYDLYRIWEDVTYFLENHFTFPYPCWDMVKLFREQTVHYIALTYYVYMLHEKTCRYDIYTLYRGIKKEEVVHFLCEEFHFLSPADFDKHEKEIEGIKKLYQPFPGYYSSTDEEEVHPTQVEVPALAPKSSLEALAEAAKQMSDPQKNQDFLDQLELITASMRHSSDVFVNYLRKIVEDHDKAAASKQAETSTVSEGNNAEIADTDETEVEGKVTGAETYRDATLLCTRLCGLELIKYRSKTTYKWVGKGLSDTKSRLALGYLCFMFWKYILHGMGQIDQIVFCDLIHSDYNSETIGTYARDFRLQDDIACNRKPQDNKNHKVVPPAVKKKIDDLFDELEKIGYFKNPN
jgi:hypothetical protein